jgi:integrase
MRNDTTITLGTSDAQLAHVLAVGAAADRAAAAHAFEDYRARKAPNTRRAHDRDLALFARFLATLGLPAEALSSNAEAWHGVTHGIVSAFRNGLLQNSYAVGSVNRILSTIKKYAALAAKSGVISTDQLTLIKGVAGYSSKEGKHLDQEREAASLPTRKARTLKDGTLKAVKKAKHVSIPKDKVRALKNQPDRPQGLRDRLLMCLFLDHGLRVGEVARLDVSDVNLKAGTLIFYRPKVDKVQTHNLSKDTLAAVQAWFEQGHAPAAGKLLRASAKSKDGDKLGAPGMTEGAITKRVRYLGEQVGIMGLSAHDCRHSWATRADKGNPFRLQEAGGWNSLAMPRRYIEEAQIANEGLVIAE